MDHSNSILSRPRLFFGRKAGAAVGAIAPFKDPLYRLDRERPGVGKENASVTSLHVHHPIAFVMQDVVVGFPVPQQR